MLSPRKLINSKLLTCALYIVIKYNQLKFAGEARDAAMGRLEACGYLQITSSLLLASPDNYEKKNDGREVVALCCAGNDNGVMLLNYNIALALRNQGTAETGRHQLDVSIRAYVCCR